MAKYHFKEKKERGELLRFQSCLVPSLEEVYFHIKALLRFLSELAFSDPTPTHISTGLPTAPSGSWDPARETSPAPCCRSSEIPQWLLVLTNLSLFSLIFLRK